MEQIYQKINSNILKEWYRLAIDTVKRLTPPLTHGELWALQDARKTKREIKKEIKRRIKYGIGDMNDLFGILLYGTD